MNIHKLLTPALLLAATTIFLTSFKPFGQAEGFINFSTKNDKHPVSGSFEKWSVKDFSMTGDNVESVKATIVVLTSTVKVENQKLNDHLKASDFLSVEKFPQAIIKVDGAKFDGEGKYLTTVKIELKGISKEIDLNFEVVTTNPLKIKGSGILNRNNHNVGEPGGHYNLIPEITITFEATLN